MHLILLQVSQCLQYDATVISHGKNIGEAKTHGTKLAEEKKLEYING